MPQDPNTIDFHNLAKYRFLPWVREGLAAALSNPDPIADPNKPKLPGRATLQLSTAVRDLDKAGDHGTPVTSPNFAVLGPGDVIGVDQAHVVRTYPQVSATDAEFGYFPMVEFGRPDFPWLFTPAAANSSNQLRPWLCLVTVRQQPGVTLTADPSHPLAILQIGAPAVPDHELPDLADCHLWAHAQVIGGASDVDLDLSATSPLTVARLLCPRRLVADTAYLACVVPTFEAGRKAGLGDAPTDQDMAGLAPAWARGATSVTLPVYYSFAFATGNTADFETLARQLTPRPVPSTFGSQPMDVSAPGSGLPNLPATSPDAVVRLEGALRAPRTTTVDWPKDAAHNQIPTRLVTELNAPALLRNRPSGGAAAASEPTVAPPIYGQWQAASPSVNQPPAPPWLAQLNLDLRTRVMAGLGTSVVVDDAEELMAAAWAQVGQVLEANRLLRLAQLSRSLLGIVYARHLSGMRADDLLSATVLTHRRLLNQTGVTLASAVAGSSLTRAGASTPMRRIARPLGPVVGRALAGRPVQTSAPIQKLAQGSLRPAGAYQPPNGVVSMASVSAVLGPQEAARVAAAVNSQQPSAAALDTTVGNLNAVLAGSHAPVSGETIRKAPAQPGFSFASAVSSFVPASALGKGAVSAAASGTNLKSVTAVQPAAGGGLSAQPAGVGVVSTGNAVADSPDASAVREAVAQVADQFVRADDGPPEPSRPPLVLDAARNSLLQSLRPEQTTVARMSDRILGIDLIGRGVRDPLEQVMAAPSFPRPMYEALRDHLQPFLAPGLEDVEADTITLVETNPVFVESFLVGANHEMSRKLLWREYPTDQRGTYFRQFWDTPQPDIPAIPSFTPTPLGSHLSSGPTPQVVLLVRGQLLRRFPGAFVYATRDDGNAGNPQLLDDGIVMPIFRGSLNPDVTFVGFPFSFDDAVTNPPGKGDLWFVIAQQPTEPRFGLDEGTRVTPDDIAWSDLITDPAAAAALTYAPANAPGIASRVIDGQRWGATSAAQAHICFKEPFRVALRAKDLLPRIKSG